MPEPHAARAILDRVVDAARRDHRIAAVLVGGSLSEGRADAYSDLDLALFVADADLPSFERDWKSWATGFGRLLLAYIGGVGHPWAVYDAEPLPLRVDFSLWPASHLEVISDWPTSATSVDALVAYDATGGRITRLAEGLVGQSLAPLDLALAFESACGDFWYYLLRGIGKLERGDRWGAHWELQVVLVGNLLGLLRLEAGAVERWRGSGPAHRASDELPPERLAEVEAALPKGLDPLELRCSMLALANLARRACGALSAREGWDWPEELADRIESLLRDPDARP
jgi:lincosamide nucleotidyltransferase